MLDALGTETVQTLGHAFCHGVLQSASAVGCMTQCSSEHYAMGRAMPENAHEEKAELLENTRSL